MEKKKIKITIDDEIKLFDYHSNEEIKINGFAYSLEFSRNDQGVEKTISILSENLDETRKIFSEYSAIGIETFERAGQTVFKITL